MHPRPALSASSERCFETLTRQNSQVIIEKTLNTFVSQFGSGIRRAIDDYADHAKRLNEASNGPSNQALAELCLKLLAAPVWPQKVPEQLCYGRSLNSIFTKGPASDVVTKELIHSRFHGRVCKFRDYNRRNRLYQAHVERIRKRP